MHAIMVNDHIEISFKFDWDILEIVKSIPGRQFHNEPTGKYWSCPLSEKAIRILLKAGFDCEKELHDFLKKSKTTQNDVKEIDMPKLKRELFSFQRKGVSFIESKNGNVIVGDEMGLGKTIQGLAWLQLHTEKRPAVIICPAHLKLNWLQEINETLLGTQNVQVLYGTDTTIPIWGDIIIVNYDIFANSYETYRDSLGKKRVRELPRTGWVDFIIDKHPHVMILDEAHYIKSPGALRTKSVRKLSRHVTHKIALTGTPIINRPIEGYYITQVVDKNLFPDFWQYTNRYCDAKHNGFGWDFSGASNTSELFQRLQSIMIRRKKKDVLTELPDKIHAHVPIELTNRQDYITAERNFIQYIRATKGEQAVEKAKNAKHLVEIEALKQLCVKGKMENVISWINDFIDNNSENGKLIVFTTHKDTVNILMNEFKDNAVKVDGSVSPEQKKKAELEFQHNDKIRIFVGNIQAAGTGLNLTSASAVAFVELPWTPGDLSQAEDRAHRIGQKYAVNIYYLLADKTIEGRIVKLLDEKRKVIESVLDGKEADDVDLLETLIKSYESEE